MASVVYFENIAKQIADQLNQAKISIHLAVAWFTDPSLLAILLKKQKAGVTVELLLSDDEINRGQYGLDFTPLLEAGGKLVWQRKTEESSTLMHNKFCVIDRRVVLNGSYNWTRMARGHHENLTVLDEPHLVLEFMKQFEYLRVLVAGKIGGADASDSVKMAQIRLEKLATAFRLGDTEDINYEVAKLRPLVPRLVHVSWHDRVEQILQLSDKGGFGEAARLLGELLQQFRQLMVWDDPEVAALQLEELALQQQLAMLEAEHASMLKLVADFERAYHKALGPLLGQVLRLKQLLAEWERENSPKDDDADEAAKQAQDRYRQYRESRKAAEEAAPKHELTEDQKKELQNRYRRAAKLVHPDIVPEDMRPLAEEIFKRLNEANAADNLQAVADIQEEAELDAASLLARSGALAHAAALLAAMPPAQQPETQHLQQLAKEGKMEALAEVLKARQSRISLSTGLDRRSREKQVLRSRVQHLRMRTEKALEQVQALALHPTWHTLRTETDLPAWHQRVRQALTNELEQLMAKAKERNIPLSDSVFAEQ